MIGRLTKDPELRYIPESQNSVCAFTLAIDRPFSKEKQADFIHIKVFSKQAENCEKFLVKGRLCGVQGRIQTSSYKNKDGQTVYTTDVIADRVEFLEWSDKAESQRLVKPDDKNQEIPEGFMALDDEPY